VVGLDAQKSSGVGSEKQTGFFCLVTACLEKAMIQAATGKKQNNMAG